MKKKIFIYLLFLLPMLAFQSCLKDQEDIFDKDPSLRVQEAMENADKALTSSENGWELDYFAHEKRQYGGYAVTVKFADGKAIVGGELDMEHTYESLYKMTNDQGPVLTFDSYNALMHYFATPSASNYEAMHGDFEFVIDSVGSDVVKVHGKKTQNVLYFRKLQTSSEEYLAKVKEVEDNFVVSGVEATVGGEQYAGVFDLDYRQLTLSNADGSQVQKEAYAFTDKGIRFYEPLNLNGEQVSDFTYEPETNLFTGTTSAGTAVSLQGTLPADYVKYADYAGDYTLCYYPKVKQPASTADFYYKVNVTLTPNADQSGYIMEGLNDHIKPVLKYNKSKGNLELNSQIVGSANGYNIWLCSWGLAQNNGSLTANTSAGMVTQWNMDKEKPVYLFKPNAYSGLVTDSFILWQYTASGTSGGKVTDSNWFVKNTYQLPYMYGLYKR